jgi:hypothetical protein
MGRREQYLFWIGSRWQFFSLALQLYQTDVSNASGE